MNNFGDLNDFNLENICAGGGGQKPGPNPPPPPPPPDPDPLPFDPWVFDRARAVAAVRR